MNEIATVFLDSGKLPPFGAMSSSAFALMGVLLWQIFTISIATDVSSEADCIKCLCVVETNSPECIYEQCDRYSTAPDATGNTANMGSFSMGASNQFENNANANTNNRDNQGKINNTYDNNHSSDDENNNGNSGLSLLKNFANNANNNNNHQNVNNDNYPKNDDFVNKNDHNKFTVTGNEETEYQKKKVDRDQIHFRHSITSHINRTRPHVKVASSHWNQPRPIPGKTAHLKHTRPKRSCGPFNLDIHYYIKCGRPDIQPGDGDTTAFARCATNTNCATKCVQNYVKMFGNNCTGQSTCEIWSRVHFGHNVRHNDGSGCQTDSTLAKWNEMKKCLENRNANRIRKILHDSGTAGKGKVNANMIHNLVVPMTRNHSKIGNGNPPNHIPQQPATSKISLNMAGRHRKNGTKIHLHNTTLPKIPSTTSIVSVATRRPDLFTTTVGRRLDRVKQRLNN